MALPLLPLLGGAIATGARVGARVGLGALRVGGRIAGGLATSFGGALMRGGAALSGASARPQTQDPGESPDVDTNQEQEVSAEQVQTSPTDVTSVGPSTGGDIGGSLRDSPLSVLRNIENNTRQTAQAISNLSRGDNDRRQRFYGQIRPQDQRGGIASLGLALLPLLQSALEPLTNAFESVRSGIENAFENASNAIGNAVSSIGEVFNRIRALFPSAAGPEAQPGGPNAEPAQQAMREEQVRATNEFQRIMGGAVLNPSTREDLREQIFTGRITSPEQARRVISAYAQPNSPGFNEAMQMWESWNTQRQRDAAYGASEAETLDLPPAPPPPPQDRTVDSRISPISREDRAAIDNAAREMNINPTTITGGIFTPSGEVSALIERGGQRREVPSEIRTRASRAAVEAERSASNAAAQADEYSSPEAINQINRGIEANEDAALRAVDRLRAEAESRRTNNQTPTVVQVPVPTTVQAQTATRVNPSNPAPPPGAGTPARPPPVYPAMINEGSPAGTRS